MCMSKWNHNDIIRFKQNSLHTGASPDHVLFAWQVLSAIPSRTYSVLQLYDAVDKYVRVSVLKLITPFWGSGKSGQMMAIKMKYTINIF